MKILFDLTDLYDHLSGIERYAMELSLAMIKIFPKHNYILLFKNEIHPAYYDVVMNENITTIVIPKSNKLFFRQVILPARLYQIKADAYVFLAFAEPWLFFHKKIYTAVHDMACMDCPESMKFLSRWYFRISDIHSFLFSKKIITISKFSAKRILFYAKKMRINLYRKVKNKLVFVPCGIEENQMLNQPASKPYDYEDNQKMETIRKKYNLPQKYYLSVSTIEPRKNLTLLLAAYTNLLRKKESIPNLVLVGRKGWKVNNMISKYEKILGNKLLFTGFVEDEDLPYVYAGAELFVFPSKYEGFGMPPLEAMNCNCNVLSSDAPAMVEVLGNHALYFTNGDEQSLEKMLIAYDSMPTDSKIEMKRNAKDYVKNWTWENSVKRLEKCFVGK